MPTLSDKQIADFVSCGGTKCPFCGCGQIEGGSVDIIVENALQEQACTECNETWTAVYTLRKIF